MSLRRFELLASPVIAASMSPAVSPSDMPMEERLCRVLLRPDLGHQPLVDDPGVGFSLAVEERPSTFVMSSNPRRPCAGVRRVLFAADFGASPPLMGPKLSESIEPKAPPPELER